MANSLNLDSAVRFYSRRVILTQSRRGAEFDVIYVNGSNNVPNLKKENDVWKVRLIE